MCDFIVYVYTFSIEGSHIMKVSVLQPVTKIKACFI